MKLFLSIIFLTIFFVGFSQSKDKSDDKSNIAIKKANIKQYQLFNLKGDTTYVDTSLTIQKEYAYNYLRKDNFGLLAFSNEGQTYNTLDYSLKTNSIFPEFGFKAKHFNYLDTDDIKYYSVPTPLTDLYFKTVMQQGQNLDAFITMNTSKRFNFSIAYNGLRSLGRYINQMSSSGNFRFTTSYSALKQQYFINAHITSQDLLNQENGGITDVSDFESNDVAFKNRERLNVYLKDAQSFLKGKRLFFDHGFLLKSLPNTSRLFLNHQFEYEYKYFQYSQSTLPSTITNFDGSTYSFNRFGNAYIASNINNETRFNKLQNTVSLDFKEVTFGLFKFSLTNYRYNYYYDNILFLNSSIIPNKLTDNVNTIGGLYSYSNKQLHFNFDYKTTISNQDLFDLNLELKYNFNDNFKFNLSYQNSSKIPDNIYNLHQSSYINYNWFNNFKNEKNQIVKADLFTKWISLDMQFQQLNNHIYFSDDAVSEIQLVSPKQYNKQINYFSAKISKEFKFRKFALDNTILYQNVSQDDLVLNVPSIVTRNTLYYSDYFFNKALYIQTGVILNYFTKYYANDYNPIIGDFFVQNDNKIGSYPNLDFFVNARIRQTRIFIKAEHFNSSFSGNNFYSAPNMPYRDFLIRFGLVWNFFQ